MSYKQLSQRVQDSCFHIRRESVRLFKETEAKNREANKEEDPDTRKQMKLVYRAEAKRELIEIMTDICSKNRVRFEFVSKILDLNYRFE